MKPNSLLWLLTLGLAACGATAPTPALPASHAGSAVVSTPSIVPAATLDVQALARSGEQRTPTADAASILATASEAQMTMTPPPDQGKLALLLFQPGDLAPGVVGVSTDDPLPTNFENDPPADAIVGRRFERADNGVGSVAVLTYQSLATLEQAYQRLALSVATAGGTVRPVADIGSKALAARLELASSTYGKRQIAVLMFVRCHALIDIRLNEWMDMSAETARAYAKSLDQRLAHIVCHSGDE